MNSPITIDRVRAARYVTPLREGGSLPGLMEADDDGLYVVKFRAAGQGPLALVAELIAAGIARAIGVRVPRQVLIDVDPAIGVAEPDPEIQQLIVSSPGLNVGSDFLPGAITWSPADERRPAAEEAAAIVWLDALLTNVDRTARNPNLLVWHGRLHAIDHGAALYRQHAGLSVEQAGAAFAQIGEHVLLPFAEPIVSAGERLAELVTDDLIAEAVGAVPPEWFVGSPPAIYEQYLAARVERSAEFSLEADRAR